MSNKNLKCNLPKTEHFIPTAPPSPLPSLNDTTIRLVLVQNLGVIPLALYWFCLRRKLWFYYFSPLPLRQPRSKPIPLSSGRCRYQPGLPASTPAPFLLLRAASLIYGHVGPLIPISHLGLQVLNLVSGYLGSRLTLWLPVSKLPQLSPAAFEHTRLVSASGPWCLLNSFAFDPTAYVSSFRTLLKDHLFRKPSCHS